MTQTHSRSSENRRSIFPASRRGARGVESLEKRTLFSALISPVVTFNSTNGQGPYGSLIADASGNLYGTTLEGGANDRGTIFRIPRGTSSSPGSIVTLATFNTTNGAFPQARLVADPSGNLYGTTTGGGASNAGTVFRLAGGTTNSPGALTTLHSFNGTDGSTPSGGLTRDSAGDLFGTARQGGSQIRGTVFKISAGSNAFSTVATFTNALGRFPQGDLIFGNSTTLYGTTNSGGTNDLGTVFKLDTRTNRLSTVASLSNSTGSSPQSGLVIDRAGNLYGTASAGGANNSGSVFRVASGASTASAIASFPADTTSFSALIVDTQGTLFGTTISGGTASGGIVYRVASGRITTLASLTTNTGRGSFVGLFATNSGVLFGTAFNGGPLDAGSVFRVTGSGYVGPPAPPEVEVRGNNLVISDGDTSPRAADTTDFGTATVGSPRKRTFIVRNTGPGTLTTNTLRIPTGFAIDTADPLAASIPAGGQDTFKVRLRATSVGSFRGSISFNNNDSNESPYNFTIKGIVVAASARLVSAQFLPAVPIIATRIPEADDSKDLLLA